ncbi:3-hydroxyacyl-CoA dehydrogenase [Mycolicibacterium mageritense DSM 44476 = CIP 104973]|uniref:L-carnitine dehydrogenase n=1 Tax=Mycolicibacterium mageritense TaxID=53462 RepID=A0ABN5YLY8_MYCME|nr:3-hydroxyacyl-CoA dehydrogenase NAD-binding domain-containing protein [Mycolicibacterium mageritense]MCC9182749.1 3-hydroxyacyl-CoA dehydrogenase NAD-binding domain-containing protein [Mycolicibacterium mageritense]BBX38277.1 L-carnitine dehydrogenase [Mycolicibacterium mageritense]CDO26989.1 putative 3-hydroxyacyl-CoA dehydrogenase [Mycolicibacterium mageritense DSM 44476 = CIP 104973]
MHFKTSPTDVRTVTCIGAGVIGGGWVAHFLARGYDVRAWDPAADADSRLRRLVDTAWPALTELGLAPGASPDRLTTLATLEDAVAEADFVQESAPEHLDLKADLFARIDAACRPDVVVGSSTSGFSMTDMQSRTVHPERFVVGHPFNPPYLVPLVEVVGGTRTAPTTVEWARAFYTETGKSVITLTKEVPGFIANRLQEALWREALHMIAAGEATVEQIDRAITDGPGLRWPFIGPCVTFHLAGGEGGMAHALEHFGIDAPWSRLASPPLTDELKARLIDGSRDLGNGLSPSELVAQRDSAMLTVIRALRENRQAKDAG